MNQGEGHSTFYFNTFVNNGTDYGQIRFEFETHGSTYKNNIFVMDSTIVTSRAYYCAAAATTLNTIQANNTFDYNIFYRLNTASVIAWTNNTATYTLAQWQALSNTPDANSTVLNAVPDFVANYTDLHPANAGNLDGHLGVAIAGYGTDKDANVRADPPNIGCYEEASA